VCLARPPGPVFGPLNATASEDGAMLNWEYFGQPRNIFVEYTVEHSKARPRPGIYAYISSVPKSFIFGPVSSFHDA
jgi:hypothetical protein